MPESIVALNTIGVITAGQHPGEIALPDQIIDYTFGRDHSIYDGESDSLDHIGFTEPVTARLRQELRAAADKSGTALHADIEASTVTAGTQAMKFLQELFQGK